MTALPTTSYAVLGLLSVRSWTAYELARQSRRDLAFVWPKEERVLYDELRRLAALQLALGNREGDGARTRTRYSITDAGRTALSEWLARPTQPPRIELEPMLRVLFADQGDIDDLRATLAALRAWARDRLAVVIAMTGDYMHDQPPFPERVALNVLDGALIADLYVTLLEYAVEAETEVAGWTATDHPGHTPGTRRMMEDRVERMRRVLDATGEPGC